MFHCFVCLNSAFFFLFCPGRWIFVLDDSLYFLCLCFGRLVVFPMSRPLNNEIYSFFLIFSIWFSTFKNQELIFLLRCSLHYVHFRHILVCIIFALSWYLLLFPLYWFFQLKNWMTSEFRNFFGLQLISFNIRQYWEFARKPFPKFSLISVYCHFASGLIIFKRFFLSLIIILFLMSFLWLI